MEAAMVVVDDYLDGEAFLRLRAAIESEGFPWQKTFVLWPPPIGLDEAYNVQYVHGFYQRKPGFRHESDRLPVVQPLVERIDPAVLIKVKVNRTLRRERQVVYGLHVDTRRPGATTAIFYLNSNNGYTAFEDGRRVESVANRLVTFDATLRHSGASCTDTPERLVLNLNFIAKPAPAG
jgi:hypothetical protein